MGVQPPDPAWAWLFRVRDITISVPTTNGGSAPTITGMASGETFDSLLSVRCTTSIRAVWCLATRASRFARPILRSFVDLRVADSDDWTAPALPAGEPRGTVYCGGHPSPTRPTRSGGALVSSPGHAVRRDFDDRVGQVPRRVRNDLPRPGSGQGAAGSLVPNWQDVWNRVDDEVGRWAYHYQKMVNDWVDEPRDIYRDETTSPTRSCEVIHAIDKITRTGCV